MQPPTPELIRRYGTALAAILGLLAVWIVAAELIRPNLRYFPRTASQAQADAAQAAAAQTAAWLGWPRGPLWTDYALAASAADLASATNNAAPQKSSPNQAFAAIAETAARLAPSDARAWLLLAQAEQMASNNRAVQTRLKMSYYTSPYRDDLFPIRIQVVAHMPSNSDAELSSYAEYELAVALRRRPPLKESVTAAYRAASPSGRRFFEHALAKLDPDYLTYLMAKKP